MLTWSILSKPSTLCYCRGSAAPLMFSTVLNVHSQNDALLDMDQQTMASLLQQCTSLSEGNRIHALISKYNLQGNTYLGNLMIRVYRMCGAVEEARLVFDSMQSPNVISWNSIIATYAHHGLGEEALDLYHSMMDHGVSPNRSTYISSIAACGLLLYIEEGDLIHSRIVEVGLDSDTVITTTLLNLYVKCQSLHDARSLFDRRIDECDVVVWTSMITAYIQHADNEEALELFWEMQKRGVEPDHICFGSVLAACSCPDALIKGRCIHASIIEHGCQADFILGTELVNMYQKCGALEDALSVFNGMDKKDVVCWTAMIAAYADHNRGEEALNMYYLMLEDGVRPNQVTILTLLGSCATPDALVSGKAIHASIVSTGLDSDVMVKTALINMYGKCGDSTLAREVFDRDYQNDLVLWNAMVLAYSQHGQSEMAFDLFNQLRDQGLEPDRVTFCSVLGACSSPADLTVGKAFHAIILSTIFASNVSVENALINMYSKCGSLEDACITFEKMQKRDVVSWNAMITSHCQHGHGKQALQIFMKMQEGDIKPDDITFLSLLSACSHAGLLEEGCSLFASMVKDHFVKPTVGHYCCMVDLLGRVGRLEDAENIMKEMPFEPDFIMWMTLLNACRMHDDVKRCKGIAKNILDIDMPNGENFVLLSNIYAKNDPYPDKDMSHTSSLLQNWLV